MAVYAVANNKGGVGKTTTACNLAYGLSRKLIDGSEVRGSVLIVDLDPQGNVADFFGLRSHVYHPTRNVDGACISRILTGQVSLQASVVRTDRADMGLPRPNLFLIPASQELEYTAEELLISDFVSQRRHGKEAVPLDNILGHRLAKATEVFDYIILDCPPKLDTLKVAVYNFAEQVIVPVKTDHISVIGAVQHTRDMASLRQGGHISAELAYIVPTLFDKRQVLANQMLQSLIESYGRSRVTTPIPNSVKVKESSAVEGRSLFEYAPNSVPAQAYWNLVEKIYEA